MHYITVPQDITITAPAELGPAEPELLSWRKYAAHVWLNDKRGTEGGFVKQVRWAAVVKSILDSKAGDVLTIEDEDWAVLRSIVDQPQASLPPLITIQLLDFSRAVLDAPTSIATVANAVSDSDRDTTH